MLPKVRIQYSPVYDLHIYEWRGKKWSREREGKSGERCARSLQNLWDRIGTRALKTLSDVSGLTWKNPCIECFVAHVDIPFSSPMTLQIERMSDDFTVTLLHELTHRILTDNTGSLRWPAGFEKKYGKEAPMTKIHIRVHAILWLTLVRMFGERKAARMIQMYRKEKYRKRPMYWRACEIVFTEGPEKTIRELVK